MTLYKTPKIVFDGNDNPIGLTDAPWTLEVQFQVNSDGSVQNVINNIFPILINPEFSENVNI